MKNYKTIESQFLPPGTVVDIEDFKTHVVDEFYNIMEGKKKIQIEEDKEVPLPIGMYILYKDLSVRKTLIFPASVEEKKAMVIALKKQVRQQTTMDGKALSTEPIYGAFTSEIWISASKMPEGLSDEEREEYVKKLSDDYNSSKLDKQKETRALIQFEDVVTKQYDCRIFKIIDPGILAPDDYESEQMTEALNTEQAHETTGLMSSLFDYSEEQELDIMGRHSMVVDYFDFREAVQFVQDLLKDPKTKSDIEIK